jgi:RNA polymerase sigma-70 factor (ECF subfamily)
LPLHLPQDRAPERSWYVNARSVVELNQIDTKQTEDLDTIFRAHYERITRAIGRVIHDQARAEELAVDVFVKWSRTAQAHGEHTEGWLYRTAIRKALDELRRQARWKRYEIFFRFFPGISVTPEQAYEENVERQKVRAVLAALNRRRAELLLLWSHGLSYQEIATSLHVKDNYVGSLVSRAQEAFRKEYVKRYGNRP